jgi:hypothetical protein
VIWGEEALCFSHRVPTVLIGTLHILVPSEKLQQAGEAICASLQEYHFAVPDPRFFRPTSFLLPDQMALASEGKKSPPHCFPSSLRLEIPSQRSRLPKSVLLTPDTFYHFDVTDPNALQSLPSPIPPNCKSIKVPTLTAFIDALISTLWALSW